MATAEGALVGSDNDASPEDEPLSPTSRSYNQITICGPKDVQGANYQLMVDQERVVCISTWETVWPGSLFVRAPA